MFTPKGQARLEAYEERIDRAIAERDDVPRPTATNDGPQPQPAEHDDGATSSAFPGELRSQEELPAVVREMLGSGKSWESLLMSRQPKLGEDIPRWGTQTDLQWQLARS